MGGLPDSDIRPQDIANSPNALQIVIQIVVVKAAAAPKSIAAAALPPGRPAPARPRRPLVSAPSVVALYVTSTDPFKRGRAAIERGSTGTFRPCFGLLPRLANAVVDPGRFGMGTSGFRRATRRDGFSRRKPSECS
jgi:hypothetical protein